MPMSPLSDLLNFFRGELLIPKSIATFTHPDKLEHFPLDLNPRLLYAKQS
jgi:hypothetical protein